MKQDGGLLTKNPSDRLPGPHHHCFMHGNVEEGRQEWQSRRKQPHERQIP